jgi:hypothetical protein
MAKKAVVDKKKDVRPRGPNALGDLVISGNQLGVGVTENLSTLTVRARNHFQLTGTVTTTQGSDTVTGTGTLFLSELLPGDRISIPDTDPQSSGAATVIAIASNTSLTLDHPFPFDETNETAIARPSLARFDDQAGNQSVIINDKGFTAIGTIAPRAVLDVVGKDNDFSDPQYGGCPVAIRAHSNEQNDAWNLVLSYGTAAESPGVALWAGDGTGGYPALNFDFHDGTGAIGNSIRMDINGVESNGAVVVSPTVVTTNYAAASNDQYIYANAAGGAITVTLPVFANNHGKVLWIFKVDSVNTVSIAPSSGDHINGATTNLAINTQWSGIKLVAVTNGTNFNTWVATGLPAL